MLSKNNPMLRRKRNRTNLTDQELNMKTVTRINLINLCNKKYNSDCYTYIKFSFTKKIYLDNLVKYNNQSIELNIESDKIYIIDEIELGNNIGNKIRFLIPIYMNRTNTCYIDLKHKKRSYAFEFIFYSKTIKKLPQYLEYNNKQNLRVFDYYNLKYRKKLVVLNAEDDIIKKYIQKTALDANSYKICVRINNKGKIFPSIHEIKHEKKIVANISLVKANTKHIEDIYKLFEEFKNSKCLKELKKKYNYLNDDNAFAQFLKNYNYTETYYLDIPNINDNDVNLLKEYLLKLILKYFFIEIENEDMQNKIETINDYIFKIINNIISIIDDIEKFENDSENSIILKFRLYRATLYNLYSVISKYKNNKLVCLEILSKYHQKIIDIKKISKKNPYYNAIMFLKEVAENLNEESALFDLLMQYNSGISEDISLFNEENIYNSKNTKYELSMLTISDIADHLKNILPQFLVRFTCDNEVNAFYATLNDLVFINEKKSFKKDDISNLDDFSEYTLPITILLLHECWGHKKVAQSNKIIKESPIRNYLRSENFDEELVKVLDENTGKMKGESIVELEYLLTGSNKSRYFQEFLLDHKNSQNENLLKVNLWVKPDFTNFKLIMLNNHKEIFNDKIAETKSKNRNDENDDDLSRYNMKVYDIDGVKVGPFFKV